MPCRRCPASLPAPDDWDVVHGRLWVWTPWFLIGAGLFAASAYGRRRVPTA